MPEPGEGIDGDLTVLNAPECPQAHQAKGESQDTGEQVERALRAGRHFYKFVLNGHEWRVGPGLPVQADSRGNVNNFLDIA